MILLTPTDLISVVFKSVISEIPSQITLQWEAVKCANDYKVEYVLTNLEGCESINITSESVYTQPEDCPCSLTSVTIPGLHSNSIYLVRVRARVLNMPTYGPATTREVITVTSGKLPRP